MKVFCSTSLGLNLFGFSHHVSIDTRIADDFVVPTVGWDIGQFEFYAYQTNETASNDTTGNGMHSTDGGVSYVSALDSGTNTQQGFPYIIYGASATPPQVPTLTIFGIITLLFLIVMIARRYKGFI